MPNNNDRKDQRDSHRPTERPRRAEPPMQERGENAIVGKRAVMEALRSGRPISAICHIGGERYEGVAEIVEKAIEERIPTREATQRWLDERGDHHQGIIALIPEPRYSTMDDIFDLAKLRGEDPFVIVLDGITDPHNFGAIVRTAECGGVHGVIIQDRRSASLTPAAIKAASGAQEYVKIVKTVNVTRAIRALQARGVWVHALAFGGEDLLDARLEGPIAFVVGSEGSGISRLAEAACDRKLTIPMAGQIESLNASVSAGVAIYAAYRARRSRAK